MKLLFENWREYLSEGMKMPEDLGELGKNIAVVINKYSDENFEVIFAETNRTGMVIEKERFDLGRINLVKTGEDGECAGAWIINYAGAPSGWGPMLYDVAIEMASQKHMGGTGVAPDRNQVSNDARAVWNYYLTNRKDVISKQLDDTESPQTPNKGDDCNQKSARATGDNPDASSEDWRSSPLSKRYIKPDGAMMKRLWSLGKLLIK